MAIATVNPATGETLRRFEPLDDRQIEEKLQKSVEAAEKAILRHPTHPDVWAAKGLVLASLGRFEEAGPSFTTAIEILGTPLSLRIFVAASSIFFVTSTGREFVSPVADSAGEAVRSLKAASPKRRKIDRTAVTRPIETLFIESESLEA